MKRDIIIIGGGIIGLMSAYFLLKAGKEVTIIDEGDITNSTSFGNAGLLSAFDKTPLSAPGVLYDTFKLMLKGESPVKIHPTLDPHILKWLYKFAKNANPDRLKRTLALFEKYGQISLDHYNDMQTHQGIDLDYHQDGMLLVFTEEKSYADKLKKYNKPDDSRFEIFSRQKLKEYLPIVTDDAKGAIHFKKNARFDPGRVMRNLKKYLEENGVEFILNTQVIDLVYEKNRVKSVRTPIATYEADEFIMSTGYKTLLAKRRGLNLMMTPAKGYSVTFNMPKELQPKVSTMFVDMFIVMTPRRDDVRITSKLEIGSSDEKVVKAQIDSIKNNLKKYTIPFEMTNEVEWCGFRPLTPNDMPLIGKDEEYENLTYGMGLGWLGMTFAPAVGEILTDLIINNKKNKDSDDILLFSGFYQG